MFEAPIYLIRHFLFHVIEFVRHWYVNSFQLMARWLINNLEQLDEFFALRVTLRHLFEPLYGDYSFIGRIIGPIFRVCRVVLALVCYPVLICLVVCAYIFWAIIPLFVLVHIIEPSLFIADIQRWVVWIWIRQ